MHACSVALVMSLCDPMDCSLPGSSAHEILQARILVWVAISSSRESSWCKDWTCISCFFCTAGRPFTTEPPEKPHRGNIPQHIKGCMWENPTANIILTDEKLKAFPLRSETRLGYSPLPSLCFIMYKILATEIRQEKLTKIIQIGKEKVKLSLFEDGMIHKFLIVTPKN